VRGGDLAWLLAGLLIGLGAAWLRRRQRLGSSRLHAAMFIVLAAGVLRNQKPEGVDPRVYQREPETARVLKARYGPHPRVHPSAAWLAPRYPSGEAELRERFARLSENAHLRFGVASIGAFDLEWTATLARNRAFLSEPGPRVLDLLGVDAILAPVGREAAVPTGFRLCHSGEALVYCREQRRSRAFLVRDFEVLPAGAVAAAMRAENGPDPRSVALLERPPHWPRARAAPGCHHDQVSFLRDEDGHLELEVGAAEPSVLVLADTHYPGWTATVDGRDTEVLLAYGFLRGVPVPAGCHRVAFRYDARVFRRGAALSAAALLLAACAWIAAGRLRQ
jgi:hypothetical protein